jgi:uncharacterized protein with HEPN domain
MINSNLGKYRCVCILSEGVLVTPSGVVTVDWRALSGFRNVLVHDYLNGIDINRIWDIIENYLPDLKQAMFECLVSIG